MQRPDREIRPSDLTGPATRILLCYIVRAIMRYVSKDRIGERRWKNRAAELTEALVPMAVAERSALGFVRLLAGRFSVDLAGNDEHGPVELWAPEWRMRWDVAMSALDYRELRAIVEENPAFLAQFAVTYHETLEDAERDHELVANYDPPVERERFVPTLPGPGLILTRCYWTLWTLLGPMAHGADEKSGNVTMFRRQWEFDALTGRRVSVPFISGNAIRGMWRDLVFGRWLQLLGLKATDLPPAKAHALLAGGSVEAGSDTGAANPAARRAARELCPPWDLFAGCIEQQIMGGRAHVHDASLVCREKAWQVAHLVEPSTSPETLAARLPEAAECTQLRLGTRHAHRELDDSDGSQMLFNVEHLLPGLQMVHSVRLFGLDGVSEITQSCLADLLARFGEAPTVGAQASKGFGIVAFEPYRPIGGAPELPAPSIYLDHVAANRDAMRDWALRPATAAKSKRGRRGAAAATS